MDYKIWKSFLNLVDELTKAQLLNASDTEQLILQKMVSNVHIGFVAYQITAQEEIVVSSLLKQVLESREDSPVSMAGVLPWQLDIVMR